MKNVPATVRLRLTVAYDGRPYAGWQSQPKGNTIQDHLEYAFARITGASLRIHGSGRTDTGVHALGQVAHTDVPASLMPIPAWTDALNGNLPSEIRVLSTTQATTSFHARFSATGKIYRYRIWNATWMHPMETGRAWHVAGKIDIPLLRSALDTLTGTHDFAAFAANRGGPSENTCRTLHSIRLTKKGSLITLEFDGDGFLYKMVRLLTGSAVQVARGKLSIDWLHALLEANTSTRSNHCAPAEGLYLLKVRYASKPAHRLPRA